MADNHYARLGENIYKGFIAGRESARKRQEQKLWQDYVQGGGYEGGYGETPAPPGWEWGYKTNYRKGVPYTTRILREIKKEKPQTPGQLLKNMEDAEKLRQTLTPLKKSEDFKWGRGIPAFRNPNIAAETPNANYFIPQLKTEADWEEFLADAPKNIGKVIASTGEEFTQNDVNTILEHFGRR